VLAVAATTTVTTTTVIAVTPKAVKTAATAATAAQQHTQLTEVTSPQQQTPLKTAVKLPAVEQPLEKPLAAVDQSDSPHRGGSLQNLPALKLAAGAGGKDGCASVERDLCSLFDEVMEQSAIPTIKQGIVPKFIQSRHFDRCVRVTLAGYALTS
jgi:hypothetical protein